MTDDLAGGLVACPDCSARIRVRPEHVGLRLGCPRCGRAVDSAPLLGSGSGSGEVAAGASTAAETDGHVETSCPGCGAGLRVRSRYLGRHVRCGGCRVKFLVETPGAAVPDGASVLDGPAGPVDPWSAPTPDPDDPWRGRAEVMRLLDEIASLKTRNTRLEAEMEHLRRDRDAALVELAGMRRRGLGRAVIQFNRADAAPFAYFADAAGASGV